MTTTYYPPSDTAPVEPAPVARRWPPSSRLTERLSLAGLLMTAAVLYVWDLGASGDANDFYAAAVQAGTKSWKAFFFGSFDSANAITVDKPPASLWPMELSGRIFGFSSWSMLVPQAIEGVLAVWLLYATVRRWFGAKVGLLAGFLFALTPVAVLMFRFNNPDALMVLLLVLATYCVTRALEVASTRWLLHAGLAMGFAFLAKGLQPFTVLPALGLAYLVAAPTSLRRRLLQLLGAGVGVLVGAGWWLLTVQLTPAADRPYIGGSGDNSALGLAFGYNGISRLTGGSQGGGPGGGGGFDGSTGIGRMFNALNGGQIAWLLPAALAAIVALLFVSRRAARTDRTRAAAIVWGGWLLVTAGVLSFAGGIIHTYYTIELAPAIAALVAVGAATLWRLRANGIARAVLAAALLGSAAWAYALLHRSAGWHPEVAGIVSAAAVVGAVLLLVPAHRSRLVGAGAIVAGVVALAAGPAAYAIETAGTPHTGSTPSAGPTVASAGFGAGGLGGAGGRPTGGFPGASSAEGGSGTLPGGGGFPGGSLPGAPTGNGSSTGTGSASGQVGPSGTSPTGQLPTRGSSGTGPGGAGGSTASSALVALLKKTSTTWAAATVGSQQAAPLELASGKAVIAIGGFSGTDDAPTLAQFEKLVQEGKVRYFVAGGGVGGGAGGAGSGAAAQITSWVEQHYTSSTVGGTTVYDLTEAAS